MSNEEPKEYEVELTQMVAGTSVGRLFDRSDQFVAFCKVNFHEEALATILCKGMKFSQTVVGNVAGSNYK